MQTTRYEKVSVHVEETEETVHVTINQSPGKIPSGGHTVLNLPRGMWVTYQVDEEGTPFMVEVTLPT